MTYRSGDTGKRFSFSFGVAMLAILGTTGAAAVAEPLADYSACPAMAISEWGVIDYRVVDPKRLSLVERFHFTPDIERLQAHDSAQNISYTLRRFQNHHRALMSLMKLGLRENKRQPTGADYSVDCYFARAESLFPDDEMVKVIHGLYLIRSGRVTLGVQVLEAARGLNENNANLHYNLGLAYVELKRYDSALQSAHRAYSLGFPLPGLRNRLKRAGKWREPTPQ